MKKEIPRYPQKIGVVASPTGAAIYDVLRVIKRRYFRCEVVLGFSRVQGDKAPAELISAISDLNRVEGMDLIILARGGGSIEELWAFNEEKVARAIFASKVPIISAVGHETDFTISDFVSDLRASTPSVAAEISVPDRGEFESRVIGLGSQLERSLKDKVSRLQERFRYIKESRVLKHPETLLSARVLLLDDYLRRLESSPINVLRKRKGRLETQGGVLKSLNPMAVLGRGYSVTSRIDDARLVRGLSDVEINEGIRVRFAKGGIRALVFAKEKSVESAKK